MLFSSAFAQDAATAAGTAAGQSSLIMNILPLILIFVIFYFLLIRPQQKRYKEHQAMLSAIRKGDKVVTGGGIIGVVTKVEADDVVEVEIANEVVVKVAKSSISTVMTKTLPADGKKSGFTANDN